MHSIFLVVFCISDIVIYLRKFFWIFNFLLLFAFSFSNFFLFLIIFVAADVVEISFLDIDSCHVEIVYHGIL